MSTEPTQLEKLVAVAIATHLLFPQDFTFVGTAKEVSLRITADILGTLRANQYSIHYCGAEVD